MLIKLFRHPLAGPLLIAVLGFLAYANSFNVPFVLDDAESITNNPAITGLGNFAPGGPGYDFAPRRWFGYLTFALNFQFGGLEVKGYHLFNLGVHLATALLVYWLALLSFRTPYLKKSPLASEAGVAAAFAGLLFVVHPVQTQAVTYVVQRLTSLCTLLYLLSLVLYVLARLRSDENEGEANRGSWQTPVLVIASVLSAFLAMKTKEIAFTLPFAVLLYELCFFSGPLKRRLLFLLPLICTLPVVPLSVFGDLSGGEDLTAGSGGRVQTDLPRLHYLFTQFRVIVTYLRLLVLPVHQNLDYDYPVYTSFFAAPVLLSFALLLALLLFGAYLLRRRPADALPGAATRIAGFGILWFFLTLSVESSVIPIIDVIFEHRLYLPSIGIALAAGAGIAMLSRKNELPLIAASVAALLLTAATVQRNQVWRDPLTLWGDVVAKSPNKVRALYNYGTYLPDAGQPEQAVHLLTRVVTLDPKHADAWHNLGRSYMLLGRFAEALPALRESVRLNPKLAEAKLNLASALLMSGNYREAVPLLEQERDRAPERGDIRYNLGLGYLGMGSLAAAQGEAAALQGMNPELALNLSREISKATGGR